MFEQVRVGMQNAVTGIRTYADTTINESVVRIAVTGLSRAGKTVFITSLVHNLLCLGRGRGTLPKLQSLLNSDAGSRLHSVKVLPSGISTIPLFEYETKLANLASNDPSWPPRTEEMSELILSMELERPNGLSQKLGRRRIRIELLDYPGEWLLDLPLLSKSYSEWSRETLARLRRTPQSEACNPFLTFLRSVQADDPEDDLFIRRGHSLYRTALLECRAKYGMRYLQPGRFLCPGSRPTAPFLWFFPIDGASEHPLAGTASALMRDRFETYKQDMRDTFFDTHFTKFDRQILLVDVLGALHAGKQAYEDTEGAINDIVGSLSYGTNLLPRPVQDVGAAALNLGGKLLRGSRMMSAGGAKDFAAGTVHRRIERLAIVATKADHVPAMRRENLKNLVRDISLTEHTERLLAGRPVTCHAAASIVSTVDGTARVNDRPVEVVMGMPLGEDRQRPFYPGDVPSGRPSATFWSDRYFELPVFAPPAIDLGSGQGIPNLAIDEILTSILGDAL